MQYLFIIREYCRGGLWKIVVKMKKVYLERRYVNCSFESTELDLDDIDLFIRSELQRYDIYESSTSSLQRNSISSSEKHH